MTRSTRLLAIGLVVLGAALVLLLLSMRGTSQAVTVAAPEEAADALAAPTEEEAAPATSSTVGELGEDAARLPAPLEVPEGHEAVALSVGYDAAVAALPVPGDAVNLYAVFQQGVPRELASPTTDEAGAPGKGVVRALSGVAVLGASGATADTGGGSVTLVLALEPADAERAIYLAAAEQVWFSLVAPDHEPVAGVGVTRDDVLD